jgi:2-hydroxy-6-oxonona-2,4-dienedioate hydrolase
MNRRRTIVATTLGAMLVVTLAIAGVTVRYRTDLASAHARVRTGSQLLQTACGPVEYAIAGRGPAVLLIHGAGGGFDQLLPLARPLIDAGFTVIAPSRFGYLRTPMPADVSPAAQAKAHACLLDALGYRQVAVLGASAGGPSAVHLCLRHPDRCAALVLVVPALFSKAADAGPVQSSWLARFLIEKGARSDFIFWLATRVARETLIETILATPIKDLHAASISERRRVQATLDEILPISLRASGLAIDSTVTTVPATYEFERVRAPTLILTTRNDRYGTFDCSKDAAQRIPGAQLVSFEDGGHLWVGHDRELSSAIVDFLLSHMSHSRTVPPS